MTDVVATFGLQSLDAVGRCYLPCGCIMADVFATVADVIATFVCLWKMKTTFEYTIHQMKPCQVDWQKLVIHEKIYSVKEKSSCFIEN